MAPRIELYAFRYRNPRTGNWVRARYVAPLEEIAKRHAECKSSVRPRSAILTLESGTSRRTGRHWTRHCTGTTKNARVAAGDRCGNPESDQLGREFAELLGLTRRMFCSLNGNPK